MRHFYMIYGFKYLLKYLSMLEVHEICRNHSLVDPLLLGPINEKRYILLV